MNKLSKGGSLAVVLLVYIAAFAACFLCFAPVPELDGQLHTYFFYCWIYLPRSSCGRSGWFFSNASMYDPYWSVAPPIMAVFFAAYASGFSAAAWLFIAVFAVWGTRLTANWITDWRGLSQQDWRYTMLHDKNPKIYFLTNLFGINLVPTLFVFAAMVPAFVGMNFKGNISAVSIVGAVVCVGAALLQLISGRTDEALSAQCCQRAEHAGRVVEVLQASELLW